MSPESLISHLFPQESATHSSQYLMYRISRLAVLGTLAIALVAPLSAQSADTSAALPENYFPSLKTLLDTALQQSPRMVSRNADVAIAEANRIAARAGQLPGVSGSFTYYPWDRQERADQRSTANPSGASNVQRVTYGLNINQPLFYWGALKNNTRIGELQVKISRGAFADAYRLLAEEIRGQYLGLIVKKASLARARFNQQLAEDELGLARSKLEKHVIAEADIFAPTIAAEQARLAADRNENDYESARTYLGKLYGAEPFPDAQVPSEIPAVVPVSTHLQQLSSEFVGQPELSTYSLENAKTAIEVENLNYKIANARLRPKLNMVLGTSQDQQSYSINPGSRYQVRDYFAGATVYWSIFDGFATKSAKTASLIRRRQLEKAYQEQSVETVAAVRRQMREIEFSARGLAIVEKLLQSSTTYVRIKTEDQGRGLASETDVQSARLSHQDNQINAYSARADYLMKVAELLSTIQKDPVLANLPTQRR
jgi:outer membrane protein TolC